MTGIMLLFLALNILGLPGFLQESHLMQCTCLLFLRCVAWSSDDNLIVVPKLGALHLVIVELLAAIHEGGHIRKGKNVCGDCW